MAMTPVRATGVECTEPPPGIESIRIQPSATSEFGIEVLIKFDHQEKPFSYGVREFIQLAEALNGLVLHVRTMAQTYKATDEILP